KRVRLPKEMRDKDTLQVKDAMVWFARYKAETDGLYDQDGNLITEEELERLTYLKVQQPAAIHELLENVSRAQYFAGKRQIESFERKVQNKVEISHVRRTRKFLGIVWKKQ
ncbi:hypothetical protein HK097_004616, partial [Rhizophlyctis rosea]